MPLDATDQPPHRRAPRLLALVAWGALPGGVVGGVLATGMIVEARRATYSDLFGGGLLGAMTLIAWCVLSAGLAALLAHRRIVCGVGVSALLSGLVTLGMAVVGLRQADVVRREVWLDFPSERPRTSMRFGITRPATAVRPPRRTRSTCPLPSRPAAAPCDYCRPSKTLPEQGMRSQTASAGDSSSSPGVLREASATPSCTTRAATTRRRATAASWSAWATGATTPSEAPLSSVLG